MPNKEYLSSVTHEQRQEMLAKAKASRESSKEAGKQYKQEWLDMSHWRELASKYNVRLPAMHIPATTGKLKKYASKMGLAEGWEEGFFGMQANTIKKAIESTNEKLPYGGKYSLLPYVGWLLEMREEQN